MKLTCIALCKQLKQHAMVYFTANIEIVVFTKVSYI